ncbi:MAG: M28 family peptidase [Candidatus Bathyarchaeota archaeon]|nr:M28 family peptidase [Candidatus Bathyarchaeota archaeon]
MLSETERRVLKETYSGDRALKNLTTLCDEYGGRFAGSEENRAAAEYILGLYEDIGLDDPHLESFTFPGCRVGESGLEIRGTPSKKIQTLTLPMTPSNSVEGELVAVENVEDVKPLDIEGKIVLGTNRLPLRACVDAGAVGFVWMHPFPMMGPPTGVVPQLVPSVSVKHEDGLMLRRLMAKRDVSVRLEAECEVFERESWNVCGDVKGSGGDGYVLLGGHHDGHEIAQAAFDCGAACMAITEMGRILNNVSKELDGDVRVVCFSAEEFGFWGSKDYAKRHADEMKDMRFTYQLDCNGGSEPQMVTVDYWPQLEPFYGKLRDDLGLQMPFDQRMGPGDSRAFHELGIPTGSIIDYREPGRLPLLKTVRHTVYDTVDKISLRRLQDDVAIGTVSTMRMLASKDWPSHRSLDDVEALKKSLSG